MKKVERNTIWAKILYVFLLYCTIFSPPLAIMGRHLYFVWIVWPVSLLYLINHRQHFHLFHKKFSNEFTLIYLIIFYSILRAALGGDLSIAFNNLMGLMSLIIVPFYFVGSGKKIGVVCVEGLTKYVLIATSLAFASSILALLIPSVDDYIRNVFIQYREGELGNELKYRGFGLGSNMTSFFSFCIGMVVVFSFIYGKKEYWFKWLIPFALIACVVNARTGVIVALVGILLYFVFSRNTKGFIVASVVGILGYIYIFDILGLFLGGDTIEWVGVFLDQMEEMASGDTSEGGLDYFTQDMAISPDSVLGWIFGEGVSTFGGISIRGKYYFSDMGFVNQLFFGGIIYCSMLYILILMIFIKLIKMHQRPFAYFMLAAFLIINFKGSFLFATPGFTLVLLFYYAVSVLGSTQHRYVPRIKMFNQFDFKYEIIVCKYCIPC